VYTNSGGRITGFQTGTYTPAGGNLSFKQETRIDTEASAVVFTAYLYNTGAAPIPAVYFWRSCDPDNDETWPGGTYTTNNMVNFQNSTVPNPTHKVAVTATGTVYTYPFTLCTKDCRAVACIYGAWPLWSGTDLSTIWNQTFGATYTAGVNVLGDIAIGLVWNIGTIGIGDSAVVSYAYVFNGITGIDSVGALPDPELKVNNVLVTTFPDTFDACTLPPGVDTLPVDVLYGTDKDWTWSKWTWASSMGTGGLST